MGNMPQMCCTFDNQKVDLEKSGGGQTMKEVTKESKYQNMIDTNLNQNNIFKTQSSQNDSPIYMKGNIL